MLEASALSGYPARHVYASILGKINIYRPCVESSEVKLHQFQCFIS